MQTPQESRYNQQSRPGTPPQPPYSPVTPVMAHLTPLQPSVTNGTHPVHPPPTSPSPTSQAPSHSPAASSLPPPIPPTFAPEPPPVPISESENPDAIALRSAISVLQVQKQQSLRDIQTLEKMKEAAARDPEKFARDLSAGKLSRKDQGGFIDFNHEDADDEDDEGTNNAAGTLPTPQNVVRMPPINWAKYQVIGESLDKMHDEQIRRPSLGEPRRDEAPAPEYMLASPYRPLVDKLESPTKAKGVSKNKKG
ncbi:hypothetical protein BJY04DRAFT_145009 [Aspergillus karnatakaensis]|uniref:uncharacterized protein n=1 Tax=Aspergillus karnatakaensis TaxID=1810916 RepID=UPI003CCDF1C7